MSLRNYLIIILFCSLVSWAAFVFVLNLVNPEATNFVGFLLFYASLFLSVMSTAAIVGFLFRFVALRREVVSKSVKSAFRQSFLFGFLIIIILIFLSRGLFNWPNVTLMVIGLSVLEFFLLGYEKS